MDYMKFPNNTHRSGSSLILVVVLTALLAAVGTIFLLSSRVQSMSPSGIEESKALESAIDGIIKKISDELVDDVPGVGTDPDQEYYDYPGPNDIWLASIEPYHNEDIDEYIWPQITDLTGVLQNHDANNLDMKFATRHVKVDPPGTRTVLADYSEIELNDDGSWLDESNNDDGDGSIGQRYRGQLADADGDGIADSKWIKLTGVSTGKGKDIYAAIRIIDNGGMINVNTASGFYPTSGVKERVDGSTQSSIDLAELAYPGDSMGDGDSNDLNRERSNDTNANVYTAIYQDDVLRRIESPADSDFQLFDMADELDLRSRFCVASKNQGRLKSVWGNTLNLRDKTFESSSDDGLDDWKDEICRDFVDFVRFDFDANDCDRRHMLTTWNMDRIINPDGEKMFGVNGQIDNMGNYDQTFYKDPNNRQDLFLAIRKALDSTNPTANMSEKAAQIMVNLVDYMDTDSEMTAFSFDPNQQDVYGFEGPCVYISELAAKRESDPADPNNPLYSYAIELYNPSGGTLDVNEWSIQINGATVDTVDWSVAGEFHVIYREDPNAPVVNLIASGASQQDSNLSFSVGDTISLVRDVNDGVGNIIGKVVDSMTVPAGLFEPFSDAVYSAEKDINNHYRIKNLWDSPSPDQETLGEDNDYDDNPNRGDPIQAYLANSGLDCIGDIGNVFAVDIYGVSKPGIQEEAVKVNLANPIYQNLFQYLTVFDPLNDGVDSDGDGTIDNGLEWKIPGRININTAPWFVLAQLPWMSKESNGTPPHYELSQAIVAYRDKIEINGVDYTDIIVDINNPDGDGRQINIMDDLNQNADPNLHIDADDIREAVGFESIGELNFVVDAAGGDRYSIRQYALAGVSPGDLADYPDVTNQADGVADDLEERDIIFARISNLITVRSDVFTAYILVRVGIDGPQQRAIAVLDRSDVYPTPVGGSTGKVKIRAFQMVSDIR